MLLGVFFLLPGLFWIQGYTHGDPGAERPKSAVMESGKRRRGKTKAGKEEEAPGLVPRVFVSAGGCFGCGIARSADLERKSFLAPQNLNDTALGATMNASSCNPMGRNRYFI